MEINEAVSERLRELMREMNIGRNELSQRSGVSVSTIGRITRGGLRSVRIRTVVRLCRGMGISLAKFFDSPLFVIPRCC